MSTLNVIGEFLDNWEQPGLSASSRELAIALANTAPRGCASALLLANNSETPHIDHPKSRVEVMPLHTTLLPYLWRGNPSARPLDGEFVHSISPLIPLRRRDADDGSQTSVTVQHTLAWDAPEALPKGQAKTIRALVRRALKYADVIVTPTHAVAERLRKLYGEAITVQVVPLAAPAEYRAGNDSPTRRNAYNLPEQYMLTYAYPGETGQLEWILRAMETHAELPPLVIVGPGAGADLSAWHVLSDRIHQITVDELSDTGAFIAGATLMAIPQRISDDLLSVYGALEAGTPIVYGTDESIAETVLDGGLKAVDDDAFAQALNRVVTEDDERERLSVVASDRARMFSWQTAAWQLWEIHANI